MKRDLETMLNRIECLAKAAGRHEQSMSELYRREQEMRHARDGAVRELQQVKADRDETEAKRKLLHEAMTRMCAELSQAAAKYWPDRDPSTIAIATFMGEIERLREQLDAAQAEAVKLRTLNDALLENAKRLRSDHARLGRLVEGRGQELARLLVFAGKVRSAMWPGDVKNALAELDAGTTEPAPATETRDAEEKANAQRAVSNAFAEINSLREQLNAAQVEIETLRKQLAAAQRALTRKFQRAVEQLAERKAGTTEPAPVAEPLDEEGGK